MAKGYTTAALVASHLGRTLTEPQTTYLDSLVIPAVEEWVDDTGGRSYGEGAVTGEALVFAGPYTWLSKAPVQTLTSVSGWRWGQSEADAQVINSVYYTLVDARTGQFYLPSWRDWEGVTVTYTPDPEIPDKVKLASTILAGFYMRTVLHPQSEWLTDYASAQDIRLKFRELSVPETVYDLLGSGSGNYVIA